METAGGFRYRGRASRRWVGDLKLGGRRSGNGLQLGNGNVLGTLGTPNLWGTEIVHRRSEAYEPVTPSCLTSFLPPSRAPKSQWVHAAHSRYVQNAPRPPHMYLSCTHLNSPLSHVNTSPHQRRAKPKPTLKRRYRSGPRFCPIYLHLDISSLRAYLFHPAIHAWLDAMVRRNMDEKSFDAE